MSEVNAKKATIREPEAIKLARQMRKLISTRGSKVVVADLKSDKLSDDEIRKMVLGPSGNLRAPAIRSGTTMMIGFHEETWAGLLL